MELWIRSQDKERLIKVNQLEIRDDTYSNTKSGYSVASINFENTYGYNFINLGTYKTKERALEVLDEIQEYLRFSKNAEINNKDFLRYLNEVCGQEKCNEILNNISVYEMPKDVK